VQDGTGRKTNPATTQPAAGIHQEMPERSQELAYRTGQTYNQASGASHHA